MTPCLRKKAGTIEGGDFGAALYPEWDILNITKEDWREEFAIVLRAEEDYANTLYFGLTQASNSKFATDRKVTAFHNSWKSDLAKNPDIDPENGIGISEDFCGFVYFIEDFANLTDGDFESGDFSFALDAKEEKLALEFCKKCAEIFARQEATMDAIAAGN